MVCRKNRSPTSGDGVFGCDVMRSFCRGTGGFGISNPYLPGMSCEAKETAGAAEGGEVMATRTTTEFLTSEAIATVRSGKRSKYGVAPKAERTYNGVVYASKLEAARAKVLDRLVQKKIIRFWIGQPKFRLGCPENVYIADFLVIDMDGGFWVEDVKGYQTRKFKRDKWLWRKYGPCRLSILNRRNPEFITPEHLDG